MKKFTKKQLLADFNFYSSNVIFTRLESIEKLHFDAACKELRILSNMRWDKNIRLTFCYLLNCIERIYNCVMFCNTFVDYLLAR